MIQANEVHEKYYFICKKISIVVVFANQQTTAYESQRFIDREIELINLRLFFVNNKHFLKLIRINISAIYILTMFESILS